MAKLKTANPYGDEFFNSSRPSPVQTSQQERVAKAATVRLNIDLDRQLHRSLKRLALDQDRTVADVVRSLIAAAVSSHEADSGH